MKKITNTVKTFFKTNLDCIGKWWDTWAGEESYIIYFSQGGFNEIKTDYPAAARGAGIRSRGPSQGDPCPCRQPSLWGSFEAVHPRVRKSHWRKSQC
ncbi:hypothetical protein TRIP_E100096 [uncultured Spirochaetota bacterium]|nr:hypothetical protein TRIP_E100096 [uncultured Spirochaetota bacterium]